MLIAAGILYGVGESLARYRYVHDAPQRRYFTFQIGWAGVQLEFAPPMPHPFGGWMGAQEPAKGLDFFGFIFTGRDMEWRNAGIRWHVMRIGLPWWPAVIVFLIRPMFRLVCGIDEERILRDSAKRRAKIDWTHCQVCGYDLRATPHRCPECGTVPVH